LQTLLRFLVEVSVFFPTRRRNGSEEEILVSSLRRHYPDQVQRVDSDEAILSAGSYPQLPVREQKAESVI